MIYEKHYHLGTKRIYNVFKKEILDFKTNKRMILATPDFISYIVITQRDFENEFLPVD